MTTPIDNRKDPNPLEGLMKDELLTITEVLDELHVARSTYNKWRVLGIAPRSMKLPNGQVRVRRSALNAWLAEREEIAV